MSLRGSNHTASASRPGPCAPHEHARVALARDDVGVRDHEPGAGHPARPLHAEPARRPEHLHDAVRRRRATRALRAMPRRGGATSTIGPVDVRERVEAAQRVEQRPGRRQDRVEALEDRRALDLLAQLVAARAARANAPRIHTTPSPAHAIEHGAEQPVERPTRPGSRDRPLRRRPPNASTARPSSPPTSSAPSRPNSGAYGECAPVGQHERPDPGADEGADREPGQRERARHEPLRPAEQGEQQHEADDDPVQAGHCTRAYRCGLRVR